jgi:hypothetical protein
VQDRNLDSPYEDDGGDRMGRIGLWVAITFAALGILAMGLLWWKW